MSLQLPESTGLSPVPGGSGSLGAAKAAQSSCHPPAEPLCHPPAESLCHPLLNPSVTHLGPLCTRDFVPSWHFQSPEPMGSQVTRPQQKSQSSQRRSLQGLEQEKLSPLKGAVAAEPGPGASPQPLPRAVPSILCSSRCRNEGLESWETGLDKIWCWLQKRNESGVSAGALGQCRGQSVCPGWTHMQHLRCAKEKLRNL